MTNEISFVLRNISLDAQKIALTCRLTQSANSWNTFLDLANPAGSQDRAKKKYLRENFSQDFTGSQDPNPVKNQFHRIWILRSCEILSSNLGPYITFSSQNSIKLVTWTYVTLTNNSWCPYTNSFNMNESAFTPPPKAIISKVWIDTNELRDVKKEKKKNNGQVVLGLEM